MMLRARSGYGRAIYTSRIACLTGGERLLASSAHPLPPSASSLIPTSTLSSVGSPVVLGGLEEDRKRLTGRTGVVGFIINDGHATTRTSNSFPSIDVVANSYFTDYGCKGSTEPVAAASARAAALAGNPLEKGFRSERTGVPVAAALAGGSPGEFFGNGKVGGSLGEDFFRGGRVKGIQKLHCSSSAWLGRSIVGEDGCSQGMAAKAGPGRGIRGFSSSAASSSAASSSSSSSSSSPPARRRPGSMPSFAGDPAAAEDEKRISECYCDTGDWKNAVQGFNSIRDKGLKVSMALHMDVIAVCRRSLQWDQASQTYREMISAYLPEDLFDELACEDYEKESEHPLCRAAKLVMEMREGNILPNVDTFSGLLVLCREDGLWEMALLLVEEAARSEIKLNIFSFDLALATLSNQGHETIGTMLYELRVVKGSKLLVDGTGKLRLDWPFVALGNILELHDLTASTALVTVRIALLDTVRKPKTRGYWSGKKPLRIVTGMGHNSQDGEAVIKPAVCEMLENMGLKPEFQQDNEGCIEIMPYNLEAYMKWLKSPAAAAATSKKP